jgi:hypothetical protein
MRLVTLLFVLFVCHVSQAQQIIFAPAVSYTKESVRNATNPVAVSTVEGKTLSADLKLAYLHYSGLYLGGLYSLMNEDGLDGAVENRQRSFGPTLGYSHYSGFYALFTYFLMSEYKDVTGDKFKDGMGAQVDLGWVFPLTSMFSIGPQLSYRAIKYDKASISGADQTVDVTISDFRPYVSLWFQF